MLGGHGSVEGRLVLYMMNTRNTKKN